MDTNNFDVITILDILAEESEKKREMDLRIHTHTHKLIYK